MVSIIIVNFNWKKRLQKCFDSLMVQTCQDFEIIMVDNASTDDSIQYVEKSYPNIKIIKSDKNLWFAGGNNLAIPYIKWDIVMLLNNDTYVESDLIEKCAKEFDNENLWIMQPKLVYMEDPKRIDNLGWFFTNTGFLYYRWNDKDINLPIYQEAKKVFTVKWACLFTRKSIMDKIGLFDGDFWSYYEETDFCHRAINLGYECRYIPCSTCYHFNGWTSTTQFPNDFIQFHNFKNKLCSFLKNFDLVTLLSFLPIYVILNIMISIIWMFKGKFAHAKSIYSALLWNIINIKSTRDKRRNIRKYKQHSDKYLLKDTTINPRYSYYFQLLSGWFKSYKD